MRLLAFLLLPVLYADAQQSLPKPLPEIWQAQSVDSLRFEALDAYLDTVWAYDFDLQIRVWTQIVELADGRKVEFWKARSRQILAFYLVEANRYERAAEYYLEALRIFERIGNEAGIHKVYLSLGLLEYHLGNYPKAIEHTQKAAAWFKSQGDSRSLARALLNIGGAYHQMREFAKGKESLQKSLDIFKNVGDDSGYALALNNLGNIYDGLGQYEEARKVYREALEVFALQGNIEEQARLLNNIGNTYEFSGKYADAFAVYKQSLNLQGDRRDFQMLQFTYRNLANTAYKLGHYKEGFEYFDKYAEFRDSLINTENTANIARLNAKFEFDKQQKEIELLAEKANSQDIRIKRQQLLVFSFLSIALLVIGLAWAIFRGKKQSDRLLLNILPASTARELKLTGKAKARRYPEVSVMFADFANFTVLSEKSDPERLVEEIDRYFRAFDEIIARYSIEKIKTIGDAYLCVSGLPHSVPDHAAQLVHAARDMQAWVAKHKNVFKDSELPLFSVRIGIHSGPVVAGVVGARKFAYDIWGDTVNTAARMEQYGEEFRINISASTRNQIGEVFECEDRGWIEVKGKGPMQMFWVCS